jgi:hypothetical protein
MAARNPASKPWESASDGAEVVAASVQINPTGLSDLPTGNDEIGFKPYVRAIAWFLSNEETKPPLTMSIEGPWGSGKSSFMLQLENELKFQNTGKPGHHYVRFNAWRSDKDEALWAAFALSFIKQLESRKGWQERVSINVRLALTRFDWGQAWPQILRIVLFGATLIALTAYARLHSEAADLTKTVAFAVSWLVAAHFALDHAKKIFGNPLSYDLSKFMRDLRYSDKIAFIERFQDDFSDIVRAYAGENGRVFIFIDDLDRCEVPRAADLLQAINLLLSGEQGNLFFILGLDREMVAAGIAAKNEKILPYLAANRNPGSVDKLDAKAVGISYGYSFMEKFIQIPFRLPRPDEREIRKWVDSLTTEPSAQNEPPAAPAATFDVRKGYDPSEFEDVVESVARLFNFNPRRLKQFVNVFRLRLMIALVTGVVTPAQGEGGGPSPVNLLTIHIVGLLSAILMRWPQLTNDLMDRPTLIEELLDDESQDDIVAKWRGEAELLELLKLDGSIARVDLRPLLLVMPDAYSGVLGERGKSRERTRLIDGRADFGTFENPPGTDVTSATESVNPGGGPREANTVIGGFGATGPTGSIRETLSTLSRGSSASQPVPPPRAKA